MLNNSNSLVAEKERYWEGYYSESRIGQIQAPSQFAAFMAQESDGASLIIEVGCGTGRDSIFFARQGFKVVAIDGSEAAIEACTRLKNDLRLDNLRFCHASVGDPEFDDLIRSTVAEQDGLIGVYARFFLHAITEEEEGFFFDSISRHLRAGDFVALEFRTTRDAALEKVTSAHYRRYIHPPKLFAEAYSRGFSVPYEVEGIGFAKFRQDDAHVGRCILRKN